MTKIKADTVILIVGKQGSGKTAMATEIAEEHGSFGFVECSELTTRFGLGEALRTNPDTLIVDNFIITEDNLLTIRCISRGYNVVVERKYKDPECVTPPNFILCSGNKEALSLLSCDRRFMVVDMDELAAEKEDG